MDESVRLRRMQPNHDQSRDSQEQPHERDEPFAPRGDLVHAEKRLSCGRPPTMHLADAGLKKRRDTVESAPIDGARIAAHQLGYTRGERGPHAWSVSCVGL